jgi:LAO/AO transport system kinase
VRTADVSIVILVPGTGDEVQALKAGIMEIADIFVVNKADREGADRTATAIESNLALQSFGEGEWRPPIIKTEATTGRGVPELWAAIQAFRSHSEAGRHRRRRARGEFRLRDLLTHKLLDHIERHVLAPGELDAVFERIATRETDPYSAAADILQRTLIHRPEDRNPK